MSAVDQKVTAQQFIEMLTCIYANVAYMNERIKEDRKRLKETKLEEASMTRLERIEKNVEEAKLTRQESQLLKDETRRKLVVGMARKVENDLAARAEQQLRD